MAKVDVLDAEGRLRFGPDPKPTKKLVRVATNAYHPGGQAALDELHERVTKSRFVDIVTKGR